MNGNRRISASRASAQTAPPPAQPQQRRHIADLLVQAAILLSGPDGHFIHWHLRESEPKQPPIKLRYYFYIGNCVSKAVAQFVAPEDAEQPAILCLGKALVRIAQLLESQEDAA